MRFLKSLQDKRKIFLIAVFLVSLFLFTMVLGNQNLDLSKNVETQESQLKNSSQDMQKILGFNKSVDVALFGAGNIVVVGDIDDPVTDLDHFIIVLDADGNQLWNSTWDNGETKDECSTVLVNGSDIYCGGNTLVLPNRKLVLMKYNATGHRDWNITWLKSGTKYSYCNDLAMDNSQNLYVAGSVEYPGFGIYRNFDELLAKFTATGDEVWNVTLSQNGTTWAYFDGIAIDGDSVYVVGKTFDFGLSDGDGILAKYNATTGELLWNVTWGLYSGYEDFAKDVVVDTAGNIYVTGYSEYSMWDKRMFLRKYTPTGTLSWSKIFTKVTSSWGNGIALNDTHIYIGGSARDSTDTSEVDAIIWKYDLNGDLLGAGYWDGPQGLVDNGLSIAVDNNESTYLVGQTQLISASFYSAFLIKNLQLTTGGGIPGFQLLFLGIALVAMGALYFLKSKQFRV